MKYLSWYAGFSKKNFSILKPDLVVLRSSVLLALSAGEKIFRAQNVWGDENID